MRTIGNLDGSKLDRPPPRPARGRPAIVDLVFAGEPGGGRRRLAVNGLVVAALYAGVLVAMGRIGRSAGPWSADMAARVHDAIAIERAVDARPPSPAPPPPPATAPSPAPRVAPLRLARATRAPRARSAAPAQAGKLAVVSSEPIDFSGTAFVVGAGPSYAGGTTTRTGTSPAPTRGAVAVGATGDGAPGGHGRARPVSLDQAAWNCPWPAEADAEQINEQTVVLRVTVGADGRADRVDVLSDPGFGFGTAARLCALRTPFAPALNSTGQPVAAASPPIRVHFFR